MHRAKWIAVPLLLWPSSVLAEGETLSKDEAYELSRAFGRCAGLFDALAEHVRPSDSNMADHLHNLSNGAFVTSGTIATATIGVDGQEFAENQRKVQTPYWKSIVATNGVSTQVQNDLKTCEELYPMQAEIVDGVRRRIYGFSE